MIAALHLYQNQEEKLKIISPVFTSLAVPPPVALKVINALFNSLLIKC